MEMMRRFKTGGLDATGIPSVMAELVSTTTDFCSGVHEVQLWYGVSAFILCSTVDDRYENKISEAQARLLTSALRTAVANTGCALPVFTQVAEARKKLFVGYGGERGMSTWFDTVVYPIAPESYSHQAGLLDLFRSKVEPPMDSMRISITARFTYTSVNWFDEWLPSGESAARRLEARGRGDIYVDHPLTAIPCGLSSDPIKSLSLSTIWPHFHEDAMLDTETYSELNPTDAPTWIVRCQCHDDLTGRLSSFIASFKSLLECDNSWQQLLGSEAFEDDARMNEQTARDVLNKNLGFGAASRSLVGKKFGGKLTSIERSIGNTVKRARDKVKSAGSFTAKQNGLLPSEGDLDNMWRFMFKTVTSRQRDPQGREASAAAVEGIPFRGCKSAPGKSLLGLFALYAALANLHNGGIAAIAVIWKELVNELRYCWTEKEVPDNVDYTDGPSMSNCLILQKIQMICTCIARQKDRNSLIKQSAAPAAVAEVDDELSGLSDGDSSDCSDFQSADEEAPDPAHIAAAASTAPKLSAVPATSASFAIAAAVVGPGVGIHKESGTLRLLRTNVPLNIPVTQEEAPMTEDMLEERQWQMTMMGTTKEAAQKRLEMQTLGLRSDMMAFKAANPGCVIADFVRWHSPRDWIANADGGEEAACSLGTVESPAEDSSTWGGHLSERMLSPDNIWHKTWKDAQPRPVSKQRVLFDCAKEAEQALQYLERVEPRQVIWQLLAPLLEGAYTVLSEEIAMHSAFDDPDCAMGTAMEELRKLCCNFGNNFDADCKQIERIVKQLLCVESLLAQMESLLNIIDRINDELEEPHRIAEVAQQQLAARLIDQREHLILTKEERIIAAQMFQIDESALPGRKGAKVKRSTSVEAFDDGIGDSIKTTREFLFRLVSARPSRTSRSTAHRMYCYLSEDCFRVSGAISTDELFQ